MADEISKLFKKQGRGRKCTVEIMTRDSATYFFAYPDDFALNVTYHDDQGKLAALAVQQTFQVVFSFNHEDGALCTYAPKLTEREKERLEWIFAATVLARELGKSLLLCSSSYFEALIGELKFGRGFRRYFCPEIIGRPE
ncbi:hypothetical protein [Anatilimnocola floriformis]|uniref:hypothetical protein n=1 Tax=Anatilimnocola floriformis TaxID=2948575 RepID=UPI0020C37C25|nr:hypothetical protein [Anatilimnocola floriformis]